MICLIIYLFILSIIILVLNCILSMLSSLDSLISFTQIFSLYGEIVEYCEGLFNGYLLYLLCFLFSLHALASVFPLILSAILKLEISECRPIGVGKDASHTPLPA